MYSYQITEWAKPLERRECDTPEPQGTEVLIRIDAAGICHSDLHIWDGYFDLGGGQRLTLDDRGVALPLTLGHEIVGEVVALGSDAEGVAVGDKRVVYPWIGCRRCEICASGEEHLCMTPRFLGARVDGGYSDYVIVAEPKYLFDYTGVPTNLACTYACAGLTAYSALNKVAPLTERDHLVIIGAGGVGMSALHLAAAVTPAQVIVADIDPTKRSAARQAGATDTIDNGADDAIKRALDITGGGAAATIDFVGAPVTTGFGLEILRKGGIHVVVGLYGDALPLSLPMLPFKVLTLRGSYVGSVAEMAALMDLVRSGKVPPIPIHPRPLPEANQALDDLRQGRVLGRTVLNP